MSRASEKARRVRRRGLRQRLVAFTYWCGLVVRDREPTKELHRRLVECLHAPSAIPNFLAEQERVLREANLLTASGEGLGQLADLFGIGRQATRPPFIKQEGLIEAAVGDYRVGDRWLEALTKALGPPARMDAPGGPVCGCGRPSTHESGWCGVPCVFLQGSPETASGAGLFVECSGDRYREVERAIEEWRDQLLAPAALMSSK